MSRLHSGGTRCALSSCNSKYNNNFDQNSYFSFPKDPTQCALWIEKCNPLYLPTSDTSVLTKKYRLCSKHFENKMFSNFQRNRLFPSAVPTLFEKTVLYYRNMSNGQFTFTTENNYHSVQHENHDSLDNVESPPLLNYVKEEVITCHNDCDNSYHINGNINNTNEKNLDILNMCTEKNESEVKLEKGFTFHNSETLINSLKESYINSDSNGTILRGEYISSDQFKLEIEYDDKIIKIEKEILDEGNVFESVIEIEKNGIHQILNEENFNNATGSKLVQNRSKSILDELIYCTDDEVDQNNSKLKKNIYICDLCSKSFSSKKVLVLHISKHFSNNIPTKQSKRLKNNNSKKRIFVCKVCSKQFSDQSNYRRHSTSHFYRFQCDICEKTFSQMYNLQVHNRIHTGQTPYKCDICHLTFYRNDAMKAHRRKSHGKKYSVIQCDDCQKQFLSTSTYLRHKRIHKNEKPYTCANCLQTFTRKDALITHLRSKHTGERPYQCNICEKSFFESCVLVRHTKTHEKKK